MNAREPYDASAAGVSSSSTVVPNLIAASSAKVMSPKPPASSWIL